jgi:hypothetical protein
MPILSRGWGMRRRESFSIFGGAAAWPLAARAQQGEQPRRIGILLNAAADDPKFKPWVGAFLQLSKMGPGMFCGIEQSMVVSCPMGPDCSIFTGAERHTSTKY